MIEMQTMRNATADAQEVYLIIAQIMYDTGICSSSNHRRKGVALCAC